MTEQAAALRRADGTAVRVLVVDDESTLSELLAMALRYEGWRSARRRTARRRSGRRASSDPTP